MGDPHHILAGQIGITINLHVSSKSGRGLPDSTLENEFVPDGILLGGSNKAHIWRPR